MNTGIATRQHCRPMFAHRQHYQRDNTWACSERHSSQDLYLRATAAMIHD